MPQVACPKCKQVLKVTANNSGRNVQCPCGTVLKMPTIPKPIEEPLVQAEIVDEEYRLQPEKSSDLFGSAVTPKKRHKVRPQMPGNSKLQTAESRTYYHGQCNQHTTVTDFDHTYVTNIFSHPEETYCSYCSKHFHVSEFCWSNTHESLTDYYARYQSKYTDMERLVCGGMFAVVATVVIGVIFGMVSFLIGSFVGGIGLGLIGAIVGGLLGGGGGLLIVGKIIESIDERVVGTKKYELLR